MMSITFPVPHPQPAWPATKKMKILNVPFSAPIENKHLQSLLGAVEKFWIA
jgi:hypothetical protein